jgi:hypothetical protein
MMGKNFICLFAVLLISMAIFAQGKGGYLGHCIIVGVEGSYMPFNWGSATPYGFFSHEKFAYNFQYGGNLNMITGRYTQIGIGYNRYQMNTGRSYKLNSTNQELSTQLDGQNLSLLLRQFRKDRGGLAPIGKFFDLELIAAQMRYNDQLFTDLDVPVYSGKKPETQTRLQLQIGAGTQMIFWNRLVGTTGLRLAVPYTVKVAGKDDPFFSEEDINRDYGMRRVFSVFFGVGILL